MLFSGIGTVSRLVMLRGRGLRVPQGCLDRIAAEHKEENTKQGESP